MRSRAAARAARAAPELPYDAVVQVLECVDLDERLQHAALVCRSWRTAAAAATKVIHADFSECNPGEDQQEPGDNSADRMAAWLHKYGSVVQELSIEGSESGIVDIRLPFASLSQLRECTLEECYLHEYVPDAQESNGSCSRSGSPLVGLSSLTSLELISASLSDLGSQALSGLTGLKELQLCNTQLGCEDEEPDLSALLPLTQLTALTIAEYPGIDAAGAAFLGQLTGLRELSVQQLEMSPESMACLLPLNNLTELECSYRQRCTLPGELQYDSFHAVSKKSTPTVHLELKDWLDNKRYATAVGDVTGSTNSDEEGGTDSAEDETGSTDSRDVATSSAESDEIDTSSTD